MDDLDVAREEILAQLKDKKLLKHSVGIIGCHYDYVEYGVVKAISEALPFDIIGDKIPFSLIYSGGEICPVYNQQHGLINWFHNLTCTLVVF